MDSFGWEVTSGPSDPARTDPHIAGTAHGHGMVVAGAAFGAHDVVPAITLGQMRRFDAATVCCASPDTLRIADHVLGFRIVFHAADHAGLLIAFTGFPFKADDVLSAIIVMRMDASNPDEVR